MALPAFLWTFFTTPAKSTYAPDSTVHTRQCQSSEPPSIMKLRGEAKRRYREGRAAQRAFANLMVERAALAALVAHLVKLIGIPLAIVICVMLILWIWWEHLVELERRGLEIRYRGL